MSIIVTFSPMSVHLTDAIVHRRSNTKQVHPVIVAKRVSFHEDIVERDNGNLIQIRMGSCEERGAPEGQEDPQPNETSSNQHSVLNLKNEKVSSLYVNSLNFSLSFQQIVLKKIQLEMEKKEFYNVWNKHIDLGSNQFINVIKRDLSLNTNESIYKVSSYNCFYLYKQYVLFNLYYFKYHTYFYFRFTRC